MSAVLEFLRRRWEVLVGGFALAALGLYLRWPTHVELPLTPPDQGQGLGLTELIQRVKSEVEASTNKSIAEKKAPLFELKTVDLEASFVVKASKTKTGHITYS